MTAGATRIAYILTHPMSARLLIEGQPAYLAARGFDVSVIASPGHDLDVVAGREGVRVVPVAMEREIRPWSDLRSLLELRRRLAELRPHIVNAGTPKAALLGMLASRSLAVPVRIYTLHGLRLETATGTKARILSRTERMTSRCAHQVLCVSPSLRRRYLELGLAPDDKTVVLGDGTVNGIDVERFRPGTDDERARVRETIGIPDDAPVVGFVGRFTRDKGVPEVVDGFDRIRERHPEARLLALGDFEDGDPVSAEVADRIREDPAIVTPGFVDDAAPYYRAMDVLAFPSYREGFPLTPLEAAASGLPVAGFASTGTVDAIDPDRTGTLVPTGSVDELVAALLRYLDDPELRASHGNAGRVRVANRYRRERVWELLAENYAALASNAGSPARAATL